MNFVPAGAANLRDDDIASAVIALLIGILAATAVQAIATFQQAPRGDRPPGIWPYIFNFRSLASIATGVVAAIGAYGNTSKEIRSGVPLDPASSPWQARPSAPPWQPKRSSISRDQPKKRSRRASVGRSHEGT